MSKALTTAVAIVHVAIVTTLFIYLIAEFGLLVGLIPGALYTLVWLCVLVAWGDGVVR